MVEKKILIVDYDAQSLESLSEMLKSHRFQIVTATDGQMAYERFLSERPDLVILEAILPKIHGFDLTKKIGTESGGRTPVIIVTGLYRGPQYRHEALSVFGATDYFEKPVDPERFVGAIKQLLHEEEDIDEDLPDSNSVIAGLVHRAKGREDRGDPEAAMDKRSGS
jgi:DNA-binding response OmpR family regulator